MYETDAGRRAAARRALAEGARVFGLSEERSDPQERELEIARRLVRYAGSAAALAARDSETPKRWRARKALRRAARRHAPGLLRRKRRHKRRRGRRPGVKPWPPRPWRRVRWRFLPAGRWWRSGKSIIVVNCAPARSEDDYDKSE